MSAAVRPAIGNDGILYGGLRSPVTAVLTNLFMLICAVGMLSLMVFLVHRGFRPYGDAWDLMIATCVLVAVTLTVCITRSGMKVGFALVTAWPTIKFTMKAHGMPVTQPYIAIEALALAYGTVCVLVLTTLNLRRCIGTELAVGPKGVYIRRVSDRWIPWSYVDKVEEFSRYGQPAFRLILNRRAGLRCKLAWFISERHPTISTRVIAVPPMVLREALYSRGQNFVP